MTETAYGAWPSPITAAAVAQAGIRVGFPTIVGAEVWWLEGRPSEAGRSVVVARAADGTVRDVLPAGWSARSRVHEYGGLCYLGYDAGGPLSGLIFTEWADQRLYRLGPGDDLPVPLTSTPSEPCATRYADLVLDPAQSRLLAVRERHDDGRVTRDLVAIPIDGSAADDPTAVRVLTTGGDFLANPRLATDRQHLAWLRWDHPNMPWDGTQLIVAEPTEDGTAGAQRVVLGGVAESVTQVEWAGPSTLYAVSDRSGWWNLYEIDFSTDAPRAVCPMPAELGGPLWQLGQRTFAALADGRLAVLHGVGSLGLGVLDPGSGALTAVPTPYTVWSTWLDTDGQAVVGVAASPTEAPAVVRVDLGSGATDVIRPTMAKGPPPELLPEPRAEVVPGQGGRDVHANLYPPRHPSAAGLPGTLPPYVIFVHGGPTSHSAMVLDLEIAYFTSRGIGVADVNYGGSTGYGRDYRDALRGTWGIVDVEDCVSVARALADRGLADPERLAIRGGSAGGWTVLAALTRTDVFACGTSLYGVADLEPFAATTHDFESRYIHQLVGDPAQHPGIYAERSPLTHADGLAVPVLLLQGSEDLVVPPAQSEVFRDVLAAKGIAHAYLLYEGEQHGFRRAGSIISALESELSFYGQVMGFTPPDVPVLPLVGDLPSRATG